MKFSTSLFTWLAFIAGALALPAETQDATSAEIMVAPQAMQLQADGQGVAGQLFFPPEIASREMPDELVFTITADPIHGRVGLAGGTDSDFFNNKSARLSYFAYRPDDDYEGTDTFTYQVRNQTTGLVYQSEVTIQVTPPPPLEMDSFQVSAERVRVVQAVPVTLFRINAGGPAVNLNRVSWSADQYSTGGATFSNNGLEIAGTSDDVLYTSERYDQGATGFGYSIPVPGDGDYNVA